MSKPSLTSQIIEAAEALDDYVKRIEAKAAEAALDANRARPPFSTTTGVIEALGGVTAVAKLCGAKLTAVGNWQKFEHFPARFYALMLDALHSRGLHADARLWGMETSPGDGPQTEIEEGEVEPEAA